MRETNRDALVVVFLGERAKERYLSVLQHLGEAWADRAPWELERAALGARLTADVWVWTTAQSAFQLQV